MGQAMKMEEDFRPGRHSRRRPAASKGSMRGDGVRGVLIPQALSRGVPNRADRRVFCLTDDLRSATLHS